MGAVAAKTWQRIFGKEEMRVLMGGLDAVGKTTIMYRLKIGEVVTTIPTIGFNLETIKVDGKELTLWDIGLRGRGRGLIRHYIHGTEAIIFVVDSNDRDRIGDAEEYLGYFVDYDEYESSRIPVIPLLIFANKQDMPNAMSVHEITEKLNLQKLPKRFSWYVQGGCATNGDGLMEGLQFLFRIHFGTNCKGSAPAESKALAAPVAGYDAAVAPNVVARERNLEDDDAFLAAFEAGLTSSERLPHFDVNQMLRISYLHRSRIPGASARATFEACKRQRYIEHATRAWFWISLFYRLPCKPASNSLNCLASKSGIFPSGLAEQEDLVRQSYTDEVLADPASALTPLPPDRITIGSSGIESDDDFLKRVESCELSEGEMTSMRDLARLAFVLLKRCSTRRVAIQRMDAALRLLAAAERRDLVRPFHETRQYVTLQLVHAAIKVRPEVECFQDLAAMCPELCDETIFESYYSEAALARGKETFEVPDLQPLPSVVQVPQLTWHDTLGDDEFLAALRSGSLAALGCPSLLRCAYLFLRQGRRLGIELLLSEVHRLRCKPGAGRFGHETLAYFCMHMVHFRSATMKWKLDQSFAAFAERCPELLDPCLYKAYYSDCLLDSKDASSGLMLPDLAPLPDLVPLSSFRCRLAYPREM